MPARFEDLEAMMDARVENDLGDSISYQRQGQAAETIIGFINLDSDDGGIEGVDPIRRRWKLSINKMRLIDGPKATDRLTHPKLNGVYKPSTRTVGGDGRDWVFNIERA